MMKNSQKPRLRFKGFTDTWEQRKLGDLATYKSSTLSISDGEIFGEYELYDANGVIGYTNLNVQKEDYITIIKDGSGVGRVRLLPKNTSFIGTMGALHKVNSDIKFLYAYLERFDFSTYITGATIPHVYFSDYKKELLYAPKIKEQQQIGTLFSNLDNLITLHQRKLEKLRNIKIAMLKKMFV